MMNRGRMSPAEVKAYLKESDTTLGEMLKFVFGSVLKRKSLLVLNVALLVIIAGLNFVVPQFTQHVIDHAVALKNIHSLAVQVGLLILTTLALGVVTFVSTYLMQMLSQRSITDLRLQTYNRILKQDYDYFQNAKTGDLMVRLTSDISNLQNLISSDSFGIIGNIFTFVAVLTFLFLQDWQLALMVTVTFPVLFVTIRYFRSKIREAYTKVRATSSQISNQLQGTITEIELIKSYTTEDEETARFRDVVEAQNGYQLEATRWQAIFQPLVNFINTISYDQERVASLNGINLLIPAGKTTALVGRSGAGKSTLIRLLTRFYERTGGDILFDDTKIEAIDIRDLRQHISIVSQDVTIVDGTIADNIRYGSGEVSDDKLWDAAERAAIADFIRGLPDGMATTVGERGVKLSGGQKQRLSIARALVKDAEIVILDEATAALDNESEKIIQHALDNLMTHKTTIVIAHRLSTVHNADQIVVLNEGEIVERGSHDELLAQNGVYKTLYDAQFE